MKTIKWIFVAPLLLLIVYIAGFNSVFRLLVINGVNKELDAFLKEAEKEDK